MQQNWNVSSPRGRSFFAQESLVENDKFKKREEASLYFLSISKKNMDKKP